MKYLVEIRPNTLFNQKGDLFNGAVIIDNQQYTVQIENKDNKLYLYITDNTVILPKFFPLLENGDVVGTVIKL